jgi:hypothetical protein
LGKDYRSLSSSLCNFLHSPVTSSVLGTNTRLYSVLTQTTLWILTTVSTSNPYHKLLRTEASMECHTGKTESHKSIIFT